MIFNMHTLLETAYNISDVCLFSGLHILRITKRKMCKKVVQRNHFFPNVGIYWLYFIDLCQMWSHLVGFGLWKESFPKTNFQVPCYTNYCQVSPESSRHTCWCCIKIFIGEQKGSMNPWWLSMWSPYWVSLKKWKIKEEGESLPWSRCAKCFLKCKEISILFGISLVL